jgi:hypothetical protein
MNLNDIFVNTQVLQYLATAAAVLILLGINVLALRYGLGKHIAAGIEWYRRNEPKIAAAVDEPTDNVNMQLEKLTGISAATWAGILPVIEKALKAGIEAIPQPEQSAPEPPTA